MHIEDFVFYTRYIATYTYITSYVALLHKATYIASCVSYYNNIIWLAMYTYVSAYLLCFVVASKFQLKQT